MRVCQAPSCGFGAQVVCQGPCGRELCDRHFDQVRAHYLNLDLSYALPGLSDAEREALRRGKSTRLETFVVVWWKAQGRPLCTDCLVALAPHLREFIDSRDASEQAAVREAEQRQARARQRLDARLPELFERLARERPVIEIVVGKQKMRAVLVASRTEQKQVQKGKAWLDMYETVTHVSEWALADDLRVYVLDRKDWRGRWHAQDSGAPYIREIFEIESKFWTE